MTLEEKRQRYYELLHAMQSGVAAKMHIDPSSTTPKHLRVGVNSAMSDHGALVKLLIDKGLINEDEYYDQLIIFMEREVRSYADFLSRHYGNVVTLT